MSQPNSAQPQDGALRVLLVEDNPYDRRLTAAMLEPAGHQLHAVGDGMSAIAAARDHAYDIILMDIGLPVLNGVATMRLIRALGGHNRVVPIVAVTARAEPGARQALIAAGMDGYLAKPFGSAELHRLLDAFAASTFAAEAA